MRKTLICFLLSIFIVNSFAISFLIGYQKEMIREEVFKSIKHQIPEEFKVRLLYSYDSFANIEWCEKDREFRLKGKLYDVVEIINVDNRIAIICVADNKEEALENFVEKIIDQQNDRKNKSGKKQNLKIPTLEFFEDHAEQNTCAGAINSAYSNNRREAKLPVPVPSEIYSPPEFI